jgi:hypothetical protein
MNRAFGNGQLEIINETKGVTLRGDIDSFDLKGRIFSVTVKWLAQNNLRESAEWQPADRDNFVFVFDMDEWSDDCHGGGRVGLEKKGESEEVCRIIPRRHSACIQPPSFAAQMS